MKIYDSRKLFTVALFKSWCSSSWNWNYLFRIEWSYNVIHSRYLSRNVSLIKVIERNLICSDILYEIIIELIMVKE